jgi:hypothetical protein
MQATRFNVLLEQNGATSEHVVDIRNVDRLQAEVSGRQNGILVGIEAAPMTWTTHWIWHACKRLGLYDGPWQDFKNVLVDFEDASEEGEEVPPTKPVELMRSASS